LYVDTGLVTTSDAALAETSLVATPKSLAAATATDVITSPLSGRKYLLLQNLHNRDIYIGGTGVTDANGFPISTGSILELRAGSAVVVKAYSVAATVNDKNLRTLEIN
jgi:hypothetical protein